MGNIEGLEDFAIVGLEEGKLLFSTLGLKEGSPVADFEGSIDGLFDEGAIVTRNKGLVLGKLERANDGVVVGGTLGVEVRAFEGLKVCSTLGYPDRIVVGLILILTLGIEEGSTEAVFDGFMEGFRDRNSEGLPLGTLVLGSVGGWEGVFEVFGDFEGYLEGISSGLLSTFEFPSTSPVA